MNIGRIAGNIVYLCLIIIYKEHVFAQEPKLVLPIGHTGKINSVVFSKDDHKIITSSDDGTLKIWDVDNELILDELKLKQPVKYAGFSPDNKFIIDVKNNTVEWRDLTDINTVWGTSPGHMAAVNSDGTKLIAWDYGLVVVWNTKTRRPLFDFHDSLIFCNAGFSPDGKTFYTASSSDDEISHFYLRIYNSEDGKLIHSFSGVKCRSFSMSPTGKECILSSYGVPVRIISTETGEVLLDMTSYDPAIENCIIMPDPAYLLCWKHDSVSFFNRETKRFDKNILPGGYIDIVALSKDGSQLAIATQDTVKLFDLNSDTLISKWKQTYTNIIAFSNNGSILATAAKSGFEYDANLTSDNYVIQLRDTRNGILIKEMKGHSYKIITATFDTSGTEIIIPSGDNKCKTWSVQQARLSNISARYIQTVRNMAYNKQKGRMALLYDNRVEVKDGKGRVIFQKEKSSWWMPYIQINNSGTLVLFSVGTRCEVWNIDSGKMLFQLAPPAAPMQYASFSPDNSQIVTACDDGTLIIWNSKTGLKLFTLSQPNGIINSAEYSPDSKKIVTGASSGKAIIWDAANGRQLINVRLSTEPNLVKFTPDGKQIIAFCDDGKIEFRDAETGEYQGVLSGHTSDVKYGEYSMDTNRLLSVSTDNSCKIWDTKSGHLLYTFYLLDTSSYFSQIPGGYYLTTPGTAKLLHYVTKDLKVITFEQLDVKYNRPDKVLEAIGCSDTALINSYKRAYNKRIKKLGIDTTAFREGYSVPEADFVNRKEVEFEQKSEKLVLQIHGSDDTYFLDRFNVWINEVPLFGLKGISIKNHNSHTIDTSITVTLSQNMNRIETSVTNINGTESYRMPLVVKYTPEKFQEGIHHFIGIGIDRFSDSRYNLNYSSKDIRDLCFKLKEKYGENIIIDTLFNKNVTVENVKALKQKLQNSNVNDQIIISYSGHGLLSRQYDYYLSTYTVNFEKPEENGLPYDVLEQLLDSIPARQKLLLIDACHSGEVDKDEVLTMNKVADSKGLKGSQIIEYPHREELGLENSFELMQSLFVNVGKNTGTIIISAAAGNQFALESGNLQNGVFTYTILEALNKYPTLKISELKKIVGERVEQLTNGLQKPTFRNETIEVDWKVW